jgi:hypothetical protein
MRTLALLVSLVAASSFAHGLLPGEQASRLTLGAEDPAKTFVLPPLPPSSMGGPTLVDPNAAVHLRLVAMEIRLLNTLRPSIAAPLAVTIIGGTAAVVGISSLLLGIGGGYTFAIIGIVLLIGSAAPLLIGGIWLGVVMAQNTSITKQIEKLEEERRALGLSSVSAAPTEQPTLRLATF